MAGTPFGRGHPWAIRPRWLVSKMLMVTAVELGHPVLLFVLLIANYASLHAALLWEPPLALLLFAF